MQSTGDVWVQDTGGNRLERFNADGSLDLIVGPSAAGSSDLSFGFFATQIAVDQADGSLYVTDSGNNRIVKFDSAGTFVDEFGGTGEGDLATAQGVAVGPDGSVYVADSGGGRVVKFTSAGVLEAEIGQAGSGAGELMAPTRIAVDATGRIYVLDTNPGTFEPRIQRFAADGAFDQVFAEAAVPPSRLPAEIAVDRGDDHLLVLAYSADATEQQVYETDASGVLADVHGAGNAFAFFATGLAVADGGGPVYLPDGFGTRVVVLDTPAASAPTATIDTVTTFDDHTAAFGGSVDPNGAIGADWAIEYSSDGGTSWTVAGSGTVPAGGSPGAVAADTAGLEANTAYDVRLVATKPLGIGSDSDTTAFTTDPDAPLVRPLAAGERTATTARLGGEVNPQNSATTYYVEYDEDSDFTASSRVPTSPDAADAGDGGSYTVQTQLVSGLAPGTRYFYRVVAENVAGTTVGLTRSFNTDVTSPSPVVSRGYEMVSPPEKEFGFLNNAFSSITGDRVAFETRGPLPGAASGANSNNYSLASRGSDGWSYRPLAPSQVPQAGSSGPFPQFYAFSADLMQAIVKTADPPLVPEAVPGNAYLYTQDLDSSAYELISATPVNGVFDPSMSVAAVSTDLRHVLYRTFSYNQQTPDAPDYTQQNVYESVDGQVRLVSILPDGQPAGDPDTGVGATVEQGGYNRISNDGSRIFFSAGALFMREDGSNTVEVSASQASSVDPNGPAPAVFRGAAADGSSVLFTSRNELTDDANTGRDAGGEPTDDGSDLYRYDVETGELTDLSVAADPADSAAGADVQGVLGLGEDGSHVYFVARGNLAPGATSGRQNLYVSKGGETEFIATLGDGDSDNWVHENLGGRVSRVTPDGRGLLFTSQERLTAYDNRHASTGAPASEVFLYDADSRELSCVSCHPAGARPLGSSDVAVVSYAHTVAGVTRMPRNLADDGRRVFFNSRDALVPQDTNGKQDVYQWDDGRLSLVSSPGSGHDSTFADASVDGATVFFGTSAQLLPQDGDELVDLYAARVGGGFPRGVPPRTCTGDECQGAPAPPPALGDPASDSFRGAGDVGSRERAAFSLGGTRIAGAGRFILRVRVSGPGRASALARAELGGRAKVVARASRRVRKAGVVRLPLRLSKAARRGLARGGALRLSVTVRFTGVARPKALTLTLRAPSERKAR